MVQEQRGDALALRGVRKMREVPTQILHDDVPQDALCLWTAQTEDKSLPAV